MDDDRTELEERIEEQEERADETRERAGEAAAEERVENQAPDYGGEAPEQDPETETPPLRQ